MHSSVPRRRLVALLSALLMLGVWGSPAAADDDDESEAERSGVEVEVRPAIVQAGHPVILRAEYEADDDEGDDDHADDEDDGDEGDDGADDEKAPVAGRQAAGQVTFVVDWGDGTEPDQVTAPGPPAQIPASAESDDDESDDDDDEIKAILRHVYEADGDYAVTVTVDGVEATAVELVVEVQVGKGSARLSGEDRYGTAARIAREDFPADGEAGAVLLARADSFADALASASLATLEDAPVLLVPQGDIPPVVVNEIQRALGATGTVFALGGESAISASVVAELESLGYTVERIAGVDRIDTSVKIAEFLLAAHGDVDEVVLASASAKPPPLAGAAVAASDDAPVLLTDGETLDARVAAFLAKLDAHTEVVVVGGPASVSDAVVEQVAALGLEVEREAGESRYETAAEVAREHFPAPRSVVVTTGRNYPDALAGAALAGRRDAPILLVGDELSEPVRAYLEEHVDTIERLYVLGGSGAVAPDLRAELMQILGD